MTDAPPLTAAPVGTPSVANDGFESFYLTHRVRLFRALVSVTRDVHASEEVAQDAFVRVWERWDRVKRMDDPAGFLFRTALNRWFQVHRRAARAARRFAGPSRVIDPLEEVDDRDVLARRLLKLPARQRAAVVLTEFLGYDSKDAARVMGIRPGTIRRLASIGRATLRRGREEEGESS